MATNRRVIVNKLLISCFSGEGGSGPYVASGYSVYEEENQHLQEGLRAKVNALKSVNIYIFIQVLIASYMLLIF